MARVYVSAVMDATLDEAWGMLRDFGALGNYHPFFENSYIEDGLPPDQVGCVRHFTVRDGGGYLRERLLELSDYEHRCTYEILHIDADWRNYVAQMQLFPVTESNQCFGQWWATFDVPPEQEAEACQRVADTFRIFFECVSQRFGKQE